MFKRKYQNMNRKINSEVAKNRKQDKKATVEDAVDISKLVSKRIVRKALQKNMELKYDNTNYTTAQDFSWTVTNLSSGVSQGTTDLTRIGDVITNKYLDIRGSLSPGDSTNFFRIVVYFVKNGTDATLPFETDGSVQSVVSHYSHDYRKRYRILWDKTFTLSQAGKNAAVYFKKRIQLRNVETQFASAGTTSVQNCLMMATVSDSGAASHVQPYIHARLHWFG